MTNPISLRRSRQSGVGLLEVLIALLVLAVGVLGFAGMQMTALSKSNEANHRSEAVLIAQDAIERFELNPSERTTYLKAKWTAGSLGGKPPATCVNVEDPCVPAKIADWDIAQLTWQAANLLPAGRVMASECDFNDKLSCVIVSWDEQDPAECMTNSGLLADEASHCFVLEVAR